MHVLYSIAATLACGVLWLIGQLFCEIAWGTLRFILTIPFIPVHWAVVSALAGPRRMAWLRGFIGTALALAAGGIRVIATAAEPPLPGSGLLMLLAAVLALVEVERAWTEAKDFLARRVIAS